MHAVVYMYMCVCRGLPHPACAIETPCIWVRSRRLALHHRRLDHPRIPRTAASAVLKLGPIHRLRSARTMPSMRFRLCTCGVFRAKAISIAIASSTAARWQASSTFCVSISQFRIRFQHAWGHGLADFDAYGSRSLNVSRGVNINGVRIPYYTGATSMSTPPISIATHACGSLGCMHADAARTAVTGAAQSSASALAAVTQ